MPINVLCMCQVHEKLTPWLSSLMIFLVQFWSRHMYTIYHMCIYTIYYICIPWKLLNSVSSQFSKNVTDNLSALSTFVCAYLTDALQSSIHVPTVHEVFWSNFDLTKVWRRHKKHPRYVPVRWRQLVERGRNQLWELWWDTRPSLWGNQFCVRCLFHQLSFL